MENKDFEYTQALFNTGVSDKKALYALDKYDLKRRMDASNYMIYSFAALPQLLEKMKRLELFDERITRTIRFVVDQDGDCWFALEGVPGDYVEYRPEHQTVENRREQTPAHSDMTQGKNCVSAGVLVFSHEDKIEKITNFSGHYRPAPETLVWIIAALVRLNANFASEVTFGFYWKEQHILKNKDCTFAKEDLPRLIPETCLAHHPSAPYQVRVYSNEKWTCFDEYQIPRFEQPKRPRDQITATPRAITTTPFPRMSESPLCLGTNFFATPRANSSIITALFNDLEEETPTPTLMRARGED